MIQPIGLRLFDRIDMRGFLPIWTHFQLNIKLNNALDVANSNKSVNSHSSSSSTLGIVVFPWWYRWAGTCLRVGWSSVPGKRAIKSYQKVLTNWCTFLLDVIDLTFWNNLAKSWSLKTRTKLNCSRKGHDHFCFHSLDLNSTHTFSMKKCFFCLIISYIHQFAFFAIVDTGNCSFSLRDIMVIHDGTSEETLV